MREEELLGIGQGLGKAFNQGMQNYVNTTIAMQGLNQKKELFNQQKKINKAKIDMLGITHGKEAQAAAKLKLDAETKKLEGAIELAELTHSSDMQKAKTQVAVADRWGKILAGDPKRLDALANANLQKKFGGATKDVYQSGANGLNKVGTIAEKDTVFKSPAERRNFQKLDDLRMYLADEEGNLSPEHEKMFRQAAEAELERYAGSSIGSADPGASGSKTEFDPKARFEKYISQGLSEDEAYERVAKEAADA